MLNFQCLHRMKGRSTVLSVMIAIKSILLLSSIETAMDPTQLQQEWLNHQQVRKNEKLLKKSLWMSIEIFSLLVSLTATTTTVAGNQQGQNGQTQSQVTSSTTQQPQQDNVNSFRNQPPVLFSCFAMRTIGSMMQFQKIDTLTFQ